MIWYGKEINGRSKKPKSYPDFSRLNPKKLGFKLPAPPIKTAWQPFQWEVGKWGSGEVGRREQGEKS